MLKLTRYYLKYWAPILLTCVLLYIQANLDLALPDYLSRIVNTGIQQGGIESPLPREIRATSLNRIKNLSDANLNRALSRWYIPSEIGDTYLLAEIASAEFMEDDELRVSFLKAFSLSSLLEAAEKGEEIPLDISEIQQSDGNIDRDLLNRKISAMPFGENKEMLNQAGIQAARYEYRALGWNLEQIQRDYILRVGGVMLLLALGSALAVILVGYIAARVSAGIALHIRHDLFTRVESFSSAEFDHFSTASLITRSTNDITQIQMVTFMALRMIFFAPILGVGGVIRAVGKAPSMAWIIGVSVLALLGLLGVVLIIAMPRFKKMQKLIDRINKVSREQLSGLLVVRAFNRQIFEKNRFDKANRDLTANNLFVMRIMVMIMPLITFLMNFITIIIIKVGAEQVAEAQMQVGDMMAFLQYSMQIIMAFMMLSMVFFMLPRATVAAGRISEVLRTEPSIKDPENPRSLPKSPTGTIEFRNVCFSYPGAEEPALRNISFRAEPGKTTAIIGSTGSGKSSLIHLIPRFYDISDGEILMDGVDIRELKQKELRQNIGYVPQQASLFSGTIASNLRYGDESASEETLKEAAETARIMDFIQEKEDKFQSSIAQGGANVSGGQKQRLSIARALVKPAPILIFDDSFSALDFKTDAALRKALKEKTAESVLFIVAQRVSTIMYADQILVLDNGELAGKGTHKELMKSCPPYREIVLSQLSIKEAGDNE